jgi:acyl-CoA reductase-like NAD-dependent aldehyde dehydrogenase
VESGPIHPRIKLFTIFRAARLLEERKEELAVLMTQEMGKVLPETRGDVQELISRRMQPVKDGGC